MDIISVIVPVYKVEQYLDKCVQSIVDQTYTNLEIILVDDGSPDNCGAMCDAWAEKDSRVRVIHKENGGLSDARNAGLAIATGEVIAFVDSDDWLEPFFYEKLLDVMRTYACDIVAGEYCKVFSSDDFLQQHDQNEVKVFNTEEALYQLIKDAAIQQVVWNKLYKKSVIENIPFAVGKYHEDEFWSYQVLGRAKQVGVINYVGYYYYQRSGSIMGEGFSVKRLDALEAKCLRQDFLAEKYPMLADHGLSSLHFECMYFAQQAMRNLPHEQSKEIVGKIQQLMKAYPITKVVLKNHRFTRRVWLVLAKYSLTNTCALRNTFRIGM